MPRYDDDWIDGQRVPPLVISGDRVLGDHTGTVHLEAGHLELRGRLAGTLNLHPETSATISGTQAGTVNVAGGVAVTVTGAIQGTTNVQRGGEVVVEGQGKLAGTLNNGGLVVVRGVFGGAQNGTGELRLEGSGRIKQPKSSRDGVHIYEW
jgi:formylmethanofuran dehydrogenase subunit C